MIIRILVLLFYSCLSFALFENQFLSLDQADRIWGHAEFTSSKFREGSPKDRAAMTVDLIRKEKFVGKKIKTVPSELGQPDGKYELGRDPAYQLGSDDTDSYLLVFLPDYTGKLVEDVKIYRQALPHPAAAVTSGTLRLPVVIDGPVAESIFRHLSAIPEQNGSKSGKNIRCQHQEKIYRCTFELDSSGTATP